MKRIKLARVFVAVVLALGMVLIARGLSMGRRPVASDTPQVAAWLTTPVGGPTPNVNWNG